MMHGQKNIKLCTTMLLTKEGTNMSLF